MKKRNTIDNIFSNWGRNKYQLPDNNDDLRSKIIAKLEIPSREKLPQRNTRSIPWPSIAFASLGIVVLFTSSSNKIATFNAPVPELSGSISESFEERDKKEPAVVRSELNKIGLVDDNELSIAQNNNELISDQNYYPPVPDYYPPEEIPITDPRELINIDYNANIRSRNIENVYNRTKITIRGVGGRVDSATLSNRSYVSFVVPFDRFDEFRNEIKSFVNGRFFIDNIYSENLLPEKLFIEKRQSEVEKRLVGLRRQHDQTINNHRQSVNYFTLNINALNSQIDDIDTKLLVTPDIIKRNILTIQRQKLLDEKAGFELDLSQENNTYIRTISSINNQVENNEKLLNNIEKQDSDLIANAATVQGTISIQKINIWEVVTTYIPIGWIVSVLFAVAIVLYFRFKNQAEIIIPQ